eukprot:1137220-Pelagomonas_calceolata.AAC.3
MECSADYEPFASQLTRFPQTKGCGCACFAICLHWALQPTHVCKALHKRVQPALDLLEQAQLDKGFTHRLDEAYTPTSMQKCASPLAVNTSRPSRTC